MGRKRFGINFKGADELIDKLYRLGGNLNPVVEQCLKVAPDIVNPQLKSEMAKHRRTGNVEASIAEYQTVEWVGTKATIPVGFQFYKGGFPSIFLMYGTARHAPYNQYGRGNGTNGGMNADKRLYDAIYGATTAKRINEKQREIFEKEIAKRMGDK